MTAAEQFEQPLAGLKDVYFVGKRKPLSDLPWWQRYLVRLVYFTVGWCTGDGIEVQVAVFTEEEAIKQSSKPGWFYIPAPIKEPLPDATCQYGNHGFPLSDAAQKYQRRKFNHAAINTDLLQETKERAERLRQKI